MNVLLIFVDGLGLGGDSLTLNPILDENFKALNDLLTDKLCVATDARLEVDGLPQSATGQTSILTGINASKVLGRHLSGFPNSKLKGIIQEYSILKRLKKLGLKVLNANMYSAEYLTSLANDRVKPSVTTLSTMAAEIPFSRCEDMLLQKAVFQDITNEVLISRGYKVPLIKPFEAGEILAKLTREYNFVLFEYFQTDLAGHSQNSEWCKKVLFDLNGLLEGVLATMDFQNCLLLFTSDHGNIEDLSVSSHTFNKVPTVLRGKRALEIAPIIKNVADLANAIESFFRLELSYDIS